MIKGNLKSVSIPGLIQMLANESARSYRITLDANSKKAHLDIVKGNLVFARFGILEGIDAVAEFMASSQADFSVEVIEDESSLKVDDSIKCRIQDFSSFHAQCAFLRRLKVGLGTEIVPSNTFGREQWQEALYIQPLGKFDFTVLGWITDGRTMRQAMNEMNIPLPVAIGILYRLVVTSSVEIVRPEMGDKIDEELNFTGLVKERLELLADYKIGRGQGATVVSIKGDKKSDEQKGTDKVSAEVIPEAVSAGSTEASDAKVDTSDSSEVVTKSSKFGEKDTDTQELPTVGEDVEEDFAKSLFESPLTKLVEKEVEKEEIQESNEDKNQSSSINVEPSHFDLKKTDPLPIVSIDIERLMNTSFNLTPKGSEALDEELEDSMVEEILRGVKLGKSLLLVLTDSTMSEASVMATYRYCLENEYVKHHDSVIQLTIDLVMDEINLVDYLLQRRRITGDQLREFTTISKRQGIEIIKLLVAAGAVLTADLDRLKDEQKRFAPK